MQLSTSQLALLIELAEVEIAQMKAIIDNPASSDEEADDAGEHSLQMLSLSATLQSMYKESISAIENTDPSYEQLVSEIHRRRL